MIIDTLTTGFFRDVRVSIPILPVPTLGLRRDQGHLKGTGTKYISGFNEKFEHNVMRPIPETPRVITDTISRFQLTPCMNPSADNMSFESWGVLFDSFLIKAAQDDDPHRHVFAGLVLGPIAALRAVSESATWIHEDQTRIMNLVRNALNPTQQDELAERAFRLQRHLETWFKTHYDAGDMQSDLFETRDLVSIHVYPITWICLVVYDLAREIARLDREWQTKIHAPTAITPVFSLWARARGSSAHATHSPTLRPRHKADPHSQLDPGQRLLTAFFPQKKHPDSPPIPLPREAQLLPGSAGDVGDPRAPEDPRDDAPMIRVDLPPRRSRRRRIGHDVISFGPLPQDGLQDGFGRPSQDNAGLLQKPSVWHVGNTAFPLQHLRSERRLACKILFENAQSTFDQLVSGKLGDPGLDGTARFEYFVFRNARPTAPSLPDRTTLRFFVLDDALDLFTREELVYLGGFDQLYRQQLFEMGPGLLRIFVAETIRILREQQYGGAPISLLPMHASVASRGIHVGTIPSDLRCTLSVCVHKTGIYAIAIGPKAHVGQRPSTQLGANPLRVVLALHPDPGGLPKTPQMSPRRDSVATPQSQSGAPNAGSAMSEDDSRQESLSAGDSAGDSAGHMSGDSTGDSAPPNVPDPPDPASPPIPADSVPILCVGWAIDATVMGRYSEEYLPTVLGIPSTPTLDGHLEVPRTDRLLVHHAMLTTMQMLLTHPYRVIPRAWANLNENGFSLSGAQELALEIRAGPDPQASVLRIVLNRHPQSSSPVVASRGLEGLLEGYDASIPFGGIEQGIGQGGVTPLRTLVWKIQGVH